MTSAEDPGRTAVFALTEGGIATALRAARVTGGALWVPEGRVPELRGPASPLSPDIPDLPDIPDIPVKTFTRLGPALRGAFSAGQPCVCVLAAGIVVRLLASVISDKRVDPAVVVLDEEGRFAVPVLSGHQGGANALARLLARKLGGQAVITTSSDVQGLIAPDVLAQRLDAEVLSPDLLPRLAAALANGEEPKLRFDPREMGGASSFLKELPGFSPRHLHPDEQEAGRRADSPLPPALAVTARTLDGDGREMLQLVPRWVVAGVGCRRGRSAPAITETVRRALAEEGLHPACLAGLATAEAKAGEPGLHEAATALGVPLWVSPRECLEREIAIHGLAVDGFVGTHAGVGAVCEPAALWAAGPGSVLLAGKRAEQGITVALARADGAAVLARTEEKEEESSCPL